MCAQKSEDSDPAVNNEAKKIYRIMSRRLRWYSKISLRIMLI